MTLDQFHALSFDMRLALLSAVGTFLARRWEGSDLVSLYHLPWTMFAEMHDDPQVNRVVQVSAFTNSARLEGYLEDIPLLTGLEESEGS